MSLAATNRPTSDNSNANTEGTSVEDNVPDNPILENNKKMTSSISQEDFKSLHEIKHNISLSLNEDEKENDTGLDDEDILEENIKLDLELLKKDKSTCSPAELDSIR